MPARLVGRVGELAALEGAWQAARTGSVAPVVVVYGEPGIGKTRTVAEFARGARDRGAEVWWGTCYEGGGAGPYAVWLEAVRGYVERCGAEGIRATVGDEARWLAPLVPGLAVPESGGAPAGVARLRLAEVLGRLMDSFAPPMVVVLDDMQWAYPESLELFGQVARLAARSVVVVCCRGTGLELEHPLAIRLADVHRSRSLEYIALSGLSRVEAAELLEQVVARSVEAGVVDGAIAESGGNPFFLGELGRHLNRQGGVGGRLGLPESIRGAVGLRLAGLSAQTQHVLQLASVFTSGFAFAELQALTELDDPHLLDSLEQALGEDLLVSLEGERYDFAHALVRQTLYDRLSPSRRARLHRRLAEALERLYEHDLAPVGMELVRQYHASATLPGAHRGAVHALAAAQSARAAGAPGDAVMMLRLGLDLVGAEEREARGRMLGALAVAEAEAGLADDATLSLEEAVSLIEQTPDPGEEIAGFVNAVGVAFWAAPARLQAIEPLVERALAAVGHRRDLAWARLRLLDRYAPPQAFGPIQVVRPVALDREAVRIARSDGTEADYAFTVDGWDPSFGTEIDDLVTRIDGWQDPVARLRALSSAGWYLTLAEPGSSPAADGVCANMLTLADDVGLLPDRILARMCRAAQLGGRGDFEAAAEEIAQARGLFERHPAAGSIPQLMIVVGELIAQHVSADWPRIAGEMWDLARSPKDAGWLTRVCAALAAQAYARIGDGDRAREILGYVLAALESVEPLEPTSSSVIGQAGAAVWELRDPGLAERLLPCAVALDVGRGRAGFMSLTELTVGRLWSVLGRFDRAAPCFGRARVVCERRDLPVLRAIVDFDEGVARLEGREVGAGRLLAGAGMQFGALGMTEWSRRLARVEAERRGLPDRLTAREAEILRLIAAGRTNKEIAEGLVISVHTVERHVQNAYRKIGARNRADASTYVAEVDL